MPHQLQKDYTEAAMPSETWRKSISLRIIYITMPLVTSSIDICPHTLEKVASQEKRKCGSESNGSIPEYQ
jgi:hypothetical protein